MTRVLCIAGSPRKDGNSSHLLAALEQGVAGAGGTPLRLNVADLAIEACRGCGSCSTTGTCVVHDDMDDVYALLDSSHAIAVATPVYFATVPAPLKALYDRCQPYWARRYLMGQPDVARRRPGAALVVGGGGDPFGSACAVTPTRSVFAVLEVSLDDVLEVVGPDGRGEIQRRPEDLERARAIGAGLVARSGTGVPE